MKPIDLIQVKWIQDKQAKGGSLNFHERNILRIAQRNELKKKRKSNKK